MVFGLPAVAAEVSKRVQLEAVGSASDVDALRVSLEDWLRPMQLELQVVSALPTPAAEPPFARVRVVWSDELCLVEVFRGTGELTRKKALPRGGPALLVSESAALIAQAGVQELSIEEAKRHPLPSPPSVAADVSSPFELRLGAYVQGRSYDSTAPFVLGGGAELNADLALGPWRPAASLLISYQGPVVRDVASVNLQVQTLGFRLLPGLKRELGAFELEGNLGGGLDLLLSSASSTEIPVKPHHLAPAPFFTAALGVRWHPTVSSAIFLRALVDFDPARRRYLSRVGAEPATVLLEPWRVRPSLQLGFSFDLISGRSP